MGLTIAVDVDGTIVKHEYPYLGVPVPNAIEVMKELKARGDKIILLTMRGHKPTKRIVNPEAPKEEHVVEMVDTLQEAIDYCEENGIELYGVNSNKTQRFWTDSKKVYANLYIDDAAFGCPLIYEEGGRPYVDWAEVRRVLFQDSEKKS